MLERGLLVNWRCLQFLMVMTVTPVLAEAAPAALPEPLTLEYVLSQSDAEHPDNVIAKSLLSQTEASKKSLEAQSGIQSRIEGRVRWVEPAEGFSDQEEDDHYVGLSATKRLYDGGFSQANIASAKANLERQKKLFIDHQSQHRISLMQTYFNVILADLAYARDNELMAVSYIRFDRAKDRNKLGQLADVDLVKAENTYHVARSKRYASDVGRRYNRSLLANLLNRPGELSANLVKPSLPVLKRALPDVEQLQKQALESNLRLQALRQGLDASRQALVAARSRNKPKVDLQIQAGAYSREFRSSDRFRGGLLFEIPLTDAGAVDAEILKQQSLFYSAQADLRKAEMEVQHQVLELWQSLYIVRAQRDEAGVFAEYRDLALDKARGFYELDAVSDLGDSLALVSEAIRKTAQSDYDLALTWAKLDALLGKPVDINN